MKFPWLSWLAVLWLPAAAMAAQGPAPAAGPGSLSGLWQKVGAPNGSPVLDEMYEPRSGMKTADGAPLPLQPWAAAILEQRLEDAEAGHPYAGTKVSCLPAGVPDMMMGNGVMQILETPDQVTILRQEFTFFRVIHLDSKHPADPDPGYLGHSIGHWDGGTLVVDTIGLSDRTQIKGVIPHTEALHVVERFRRTGPDRLSITATVDDPKTFTKPWTLATTLKRESGELMEYFCDNNRNAPDASGHTSVQMPGRP